MANDRSARRRQAIAYHEAGHALAMWRGELPFKSITVVATDNYLGRVLSHRLSVTDAQIYNMSPRTRDLFERKIGALLAGPEAQRLVRGRYDHVGAMDDCDQARDLVRRVIDLADEARWYYRWLRARAKNLVEHPMRRKSLDALAGALMQHGTLTGDEAVQIMQTAVLPPTLLMAPPV